MTYPTVLRMVSMATMLSCLLCTSWVRCQTDDKYVIRLETVSDCIVDEEAEYQQFYDTSQLRCINCGQNNSVQIASEDGLGCACREDYKITSSLGNPRNVSCEPCPVGEVASRDGWNCVTCNVTSSPVDDVCPECRNANSIKVDRNLTGHWLTDDRGDDTVSCLSCQYDTAPDGQRDRCVRCNQKLSVLPNQGCLCPADKQAGGLCFGSSEDLLDESRLVYSVIYDKTTQVESAYLTAHLRSAQSSCTNFTKLHPSRLDYSNLTSCQNLANMCVMTLYSTRCEPPQSQDDPCSLYLRLVQSYTDSTFPAHSDGSRSRNNKIFSWKANMPWLYYLSDLDDKPEAVLTDQSIDQTYTRRSYIELLAHEYSLQGIYLGTKTLDAVPLSLCPIGAGEMKSALKYGNKFFKKCSVSLDSLFTSSILPQNFYELYLAYVSSSTNAKLLHAVPVLLTNYSTPEGERVNEGEDISKWQLLRRYFVLDRVTGLALGEETPSVVRYLRDVTIHIRQQSTSTPGLIYPAYVEMTYDYVTSEQRDQGLFVEVTFAIRYHADLTRTGRDLSIAVGVMSSVALVWAIIQTGNWNRRQGNVSIDFSVVIRFLAYTSGSLANVFFVTMLGYSLWQFTIYKAQTEVFLVPDDGSELYVTAFIASAFCLKLVDVIHLIIAQSTVDVMFVDWERRPAKRDRKSSAHQEASAWRRVMLANEWCELQTERQIKPFWQLMFILVVLEAAGVKNLARVETVSRLQQDETDSGSPYNTTFRIALSASIYIGLALVQWTYNRFWSSCVRDKMMNFVDLCSLANVSVFILPSKLFGYYIHGRSVHGQADVSLKDMYYNMLMEERDLCGHRGLLPGSDIQTFEVFITNELRSLYDKLLYSSPKIPPNTSTTSNRIVLDPETERQLAVFSQLNKLLQKYIDHDLRGHDYVITEKNTFQRIMDYDPIKGFDVGYFFIDGGHSFDKVLFYGQETLLVVYEVLTFSVVDLLSANFVLAAILTYVMCQIIVAIRYAAGRKNLSLKSTVDLRFLV